MVLSGRFLAVLAVLAVALVLPSSALALPAPVLLGTTGGTGNNNIPVPPSNLYRVDPATGAVTSLGNTGYAITGLAQDPTTGILYAVSNSRSPVGPLTLLTLDPATGAAKEIGSLGGERIADISFDSRGRLFGWSEGEEGDHLASIDKLTGRVTLIPGNLGTLGSGSSFDLNDTYWIFGEGEEGAYHTVDTTSGVATERGTLQPIGEELGRSVSAAAWDCARTTLYATLNPGQLAVPTATTASLVTIDTTNGATANRGTTVTGADGLAWFCPLAFEFQSPPIVVPPGGAKTFTVPVVRGPRIKGSATVGFTAVSGTALAGRDFDAALGTISFPNNVTNASAALTVKPDPKAGSNREFTLALSNPSGGGSVGPPLTVTIEAGKPARPKVKGPKETDASRVVFKLRSNQIPARFRCKLDKGKFRGCGKAGKKARKFETPELAPGEHTLTVQVVNGAGKKSKPAKKTFVVLGD